MSYRVAIYFAPDATSPLWLKAAQWLGRDALAGTEYADDIGGITRAEINEKSASARRYAFHATIKSPMAVAPGKSEAELDAALAAFAAAHAPVPIGKLKLARLNGVLALSPAAQPPALTRQRAGRAARRVGVADLRLVLPSAGHRARAVHHDVQRRASACADRRVRGLLDER